MNLLAALEERLPGEPALAPQEGLLLYALAQATRPTYVLETGTNRGLSTLALAAGAAPDGHVYTYDIEDYGGAAQERWERHGAAPFITAYRRSSLEPEEPARVHMAFFDVGDGPSDPGIGNGEHTPDYLRREWVVWKPRLASGALLVWHDCPPGSPSLDALLQLCVEEPLTICPLTTPCAMVLGIWQPQLWWDPRIVAMVRAKQAGTLPAERGSRWS